MFRLVELLWNAAVSGMFRRPMAPAPATRDRGNGDLIGVFVMVLLVLITVAVLGLFVLGEG